MLLLSQISYLRSKKGSTIIILAIAAFLAFANSVPAFDYSLYKPSTIFAEFTQIETDHQDMLQGDNPVDILIHPPVPFSIIAKYLNEQREISIDNKKSLAIFAKVFDKPIALEIYKHEILILDSDNREYWLPIQEGFIEDFHKEYYKDCNLTLYLIISIIDNHRPLILINEFRVE